MHMRAPLGTRIEVSGRIATLVSNSIQELLPGEVENVVSNCGLPVGPHNLAFIPTPTIGPQDCDLTILLKNEKSPVWDYRRILRKGLRGQDQRRVAGRAAVGTGAGACITVSLLAMAAPPVMSANLARGAPRRARRGSARA